MLAVAPSSINASASLNFIVSLYSFSSANNVVNYSLVSPPAMSGAGLALLSNGALLLFGGVTVSSGAYSNSVYSSSTSTGIGFSSVGNAAWSARSSFISCVQPFSNVVVLFGGVNAAGELNDGWSNADGTGSTWSSLPSSLPWGSTGLQSGSCVFLYDSALVPGRSFAQSASTLLVFTEHDLYYRSTTAGQTWVQQPNPYAPNAPTYQTAPWSTQADTTLQRLSMRVVADFDNILYAAGGSEVQDGIVWMSSDSAMTWYRLAQRNAITASSAAQLMMASSSCLGLNYRTGNNGGTAYNKTLVLYGGQISLTDGTQMQSLGLVSSQSPTFVPISNAAPFNATSVTGQGPSGAGPATGTASSSSSSSSTSVPRGSSSSSSSSSGGSVPSTTAGTGSSDSGSSGLSGGDIAGIVIGSVVGAVLLLVCLLYLCLVINRGGKNGAPARMIDTESSRSTAPGTVVVPTQNREMETSQIELE